MLKGAIFDMDGVIVNSHPTHIRAWRRVLASFGINPTDEELEIVRDGKKKEEILRHFDGDLTDDQVQVYAQEKDRLFREESRGVTMIGGVEELLVELNRAAIPVAMASSGSSWRVQHTLDLFQLRSHFSVVLTGDEFTAGKADSKIFRKAAEEMGVRSEESLVFEDSVSGVRSAKAIGMKCLGIGSAFRAKLLLEAGAERVYSDFVDTRLSHLQTLFA